MTMQPFPCDTCAAPNTPYSIMFRCGTCYYQNGKMPTKYIPIDAVIAKAEHPLDKKADNALKEKNNG